MCGWSRVILSVAAATAASAAGAADFRALEVSRDGDQYTVQATVYLAAPPEAVFAVLTDYEHLTRISPSVVESRRVKQLDSADTLVYTDTRFCALFFCRHVRETEKLTATPPGDIASLVLPDKGGNVRSGSATLHLETEGEGTLMHWRIQFEPGFWVPPLIGPPLVERSLKAEGRRSAEGVERLAREHANMAPLDGAEDHGKTDNKASAAGTH